MKKHFLTGLLTIAPFGITLLLVIFFINMITSPFENSVADLLRPYAMFSQSFFFFKGEQSLYFISKIITLISLIMIIFVIGFLGRRVIPKGFFLYIYRLIKKIPYVRGIYKTMRQIVKATFGSKENLFSHVVLVPFPNTHGYILGMLPADQANKKPFESVTLFVSGTPNPTMALMLTYKREEIIMTDITVEEAFKFILSCGLNIRHYEVKHSIISNQVSSL